MRAGVRWTRQRRRGKAMTGRATVSHARRDTTRRRKSGRAGYRGRAHASVRCFRRGCPRTEKSCGPDARGSGVKSRGDVAANRRHIDQRRGDGGNSATLPEESTKDTVKTIRAGKAGRPASPVVHPVCFFIARGPRVPPAPGLPCALWLSWGVNEQQSSGERSRENVQACLRGRG
jgi:hypothetical protein